MNRKYGIRLPIIIPLIGIAIVLTILMLAFNKTSVQADINEIKHEERHKMPKSSDYWTEYLGLNIAKEEVQEVTEEPIEEPSYDYQEEYVGPAYSYQIEGVPSLLQYDLGLPTGCEGVSLTMCLLYNGYNVSAWDVCETYMPRDYNCTDPNVAFIGDPADGRCYGCNAPVIVQTALNVGANPVNLTGNLDAVYNEIINGYPVVIWGTDKWQPSWWHTCTMNGVDYFDWHGPFHCMCLTGFTDTTVTINDPYYGVTTVDKTLFETRWQEMGGMAVAVH